MSANSDMIMRVAENLSTLKRELKKPNSIRASSRGRPRLAEHGELVTLRMPPEIMDRIEQIASGELEKKTVVLRRLIRRGLQLETSSEPDVAKVPETARKVDQQQREHKPPLLNRQVKGPAMAPIFLRRRDAAAALAVSESQLLCWERAGRLSPIRLGDLRVVRYRREDVEALAELLANEASKNGTSPEV